MAKRRQEEQVLRITAQYVEEWRAGMQPKASDYVARYPQYAEEIADYIAYYHAFEEELPARSEVMALPPELRIAITAVWQRMAQAGELPGELPKVAEAPAHYETGAAGCSGGGTGGAGAVEPETLAGDE